MFLWTHRKQKWRNWEKFPPTFRNDLPWSAKVVKAICIFSQQWFPQLVPLAQRVQFWQRCQTVVAEVRKFFPQIWRSMKNWKKSHTKCFRKHNFVKTKIFHRKVPLAHRLQLLQNCRHFPRKVQNDVAWIPNFFWFYIFFWKKLFPH